MMTSRELFAYIVGWYFSGVVSRAQYRESLSYAGNPQAVPRMEGAGSETPATQPHQVHEAGAPHTPTRERKDLLNQFASVQNAPGELTTDLYIAAGKNDTSEPMND